MQFDSTYLWLLIPVALVGAILVAHGGVRKCLWAAGLTLLVLALARPQLGREEPSADGEGGDIFLVFDISRSMLGQDIPPNRIQFSLLFAERLVHELPGFRFALFPFAGDAYLQMPLTNDPDATVEMLSYLSPDVVTSPSSHLDNALKKLFETTQRLKVSSPQIVVFSDGEMEEPIGSDTLGLFIKHEIPIHTIAAATPQGANVPIESRFVSGAGSHGHLSQLNRALLEKLSNATGGRTFPARLDQVKAVTETLKPTGAHRLTFHPTMDLFPHLIALALIFFVWELSRRRWPVLLRSLVICSLVSAGTLARADEPVDPERQAILLFNRATGDEASGRFDDAQEGFQQAESLSHNPELRKKALFNLGNMALRQGDGQTALDLYQQAHDVVMKGSREIDQRITENMALVARLLAKQSQNGQGEGKDPQNPQDPKGPQKNFQSQNFSGDQKRKLFELLSNEERQALQRIMESRNRNRTAKYVDKPW